MTTMTATIARRDSRRAGRCCATRPTSPVRSTRALWRQPAFAVATLVQPIIWLLLFGELFRPVVDLPGFAERGTYLEFITPGVVIMTALFSSGWAGTSTSRT